jgi:hypothetical protein
MQIRTRFGTSADGCVTHWTQSPEENSVTP